MASTKVVGFTVSAIVVVNAASDVIDPDTTQPITRAQTEDGLLLLDMGRAAAPGHMPVRLLAGTNTTLAVVATNLVLTKIQA